VLACARRDLLPSWPEPSLCQGEEELNRPGALVKLDCLGSVDISPPEGLPPTLDTSANAIAMASIPMTKLPAQMLSFRDKHKLVTDPR
jgi:hypothetical protein